jgi:EAL domain-containing protein (putative c-di-GMP-specific phosphodiesterase class I)
MPGLTGTALLRKVRETHLDLPVILVTGEPSLGTAIEAVEYGAMRYLDKPVEPEELVGTVQRAVRLNRVAELRRELANELGQLAQADGDRAGLDVRFGRALAGLFLVYQPIVDWPKRRLFGYEALVRSNEETLPHPGALFDAAERLDRLHDLGRAIRDRAPEPFERARNGEQLFVNLHTRDLLDDTLFAPDAPLAALADRTVLEITERAKLEQVPDAKTRCERLSERGFRLAIDDIGAGYAGLTSFAVLEPEVVKLDMALVRGVHESRTKQKLVKTLIGLCNELDIVVIGEGVETEAERDALAELGCHLMQGFLFAKPSPPFVAPCF